MFEEHAAKGTPSAAATETAYRMRVLRAVARFMLGVSGHMPARRRPSHGAERNTRETFLAVGDATPCPTRSRLPGRRALCPLAGLGLRAQTFCLDTWCAA